MAEESEDRHKSEFSQRLERATDQMQGLQRKGEEGKGDVGSKLAKVGLRPGSLWMLKWRTGALTSVLVRIL